MLNYLRSELYRGAHQRGIKYFMLLCLGILGFIAVLSSAAEQAGFLYLANLRILAMLACLTIFPAVFIALDRKERGIHIQMISFGTRRTTILIGDFLILVFELLLAAVFLTATALLFARILPANAIIPLTSDHAIEFAQTIGYYYVLILPLLAMGLSFSYLLNNLGLSITVFFTAGFILPQILTSFIAKRWVEILLNFMPAFHMMEVAKGIGEFDVQWIGLCIAANLAVWLAAAVVIYHRKEL